MNNGIVFNNGSVYEHRRRPWSERNYRNRNGVIINYQDLFLYNENGEPDMVPDGKGGMIQRTWGEILNFHHRHSLKLDPVIHKDVIKAIRNRKTTVSSHNPSNPGIGDLVEYEPEVMRQAEFDETNMVIEAMTLLNAVVKEKDKRNFFYLCGILGIDPVEDRVAVVQLKQVVEQTPDVFLACFDKQDNISPDLVDEAIVKLALRLKLIQLKRGVWFFEETQLNSNSAKIHIENQEIIPAIKTALDKVMSKYGVSVQQKGRRKKEEDHFAV